MKLRNLTLVAGLLGAFFTNSAFALGMGEIKLNSSLNEPLDAEIQLLNVGDLSELEMLVGLGSREDFEAAGVERVFLLTDLRFKVDMSAPDNPVLRVSSRKPIREPYLDFLLEVQWPSGRLLREYTLLLDLPVYATAGAPAKKIKAASSSPQPQVPAPVTTVKPTSSSVPSSSQSGAPFSGGEYNVAPGDTAWGIARKIKPDDATIMQSLAAVKQSNPHAFINGDINLLKRGAVLRLPSSSEIAQLSDREIKTAIDFSTGDTAPVAEADVVPSAQQLDATGSVDEETTSPQPQGGGRLQLAALGDQEADSDGVVSSDGPASDVLGSVSRDTEALQNDFTIFQEELDKTQRENEELKARLSIMEEQIATMSRLVEINDDTFRAAQVASQQSETDAAQETDEASQPAVTTTAVSKSEDSAASQQTSQVNESGDAETSGFKNWLSLLLYPLIGLLVLLLAIVLFFRNRKSEEEEPEEELSLQTLVTAKDDEKADNDIDDLDALLDEEDKELLDEVVSEFDEQKPSDLEGLELNEGEDVDPLGEADIYLSLGNYKQAEKVLLKAVETSPEDPSLRLKLMEVYVSSNDLDKFDIQYQALADLENSEAGIKADSLRSVLEPDVSSEPERYDIASDDVGEADDKESEISSLDDVDLDFDNLEAESPAPEELSKELDNLDAKVSELETSEFDLDLDLDSLDLENLDLEKVDLDSLSSDIDEEMDSFDLDGDSSESEKEESRADDLDLDSRTSVLDTEADEGEGAADTDKTVGLDTAEDDFDHFDDDLDLLEGEDECSTKLELAQAYMDMGDAESAKEILDEVVSAGDDAQQDQARKLLEDIT